MIMFLIIAFGILYLNKKRKDAQKEPGVYQRKTKYYTTMNFDASPQSRELYDSMCGSDVDEARLTKFLQMEDNFLGYKKAILNDGAGTYREASDLSSLITNTFSNWDTEYHGNHLKQMQNPDVNLNFDSLESERSLWCSLSRPRPRYWCFTLYRCFGRRCIQHLVSG